MAKVNLKIGRKARKSNKKKVKPSKNLTKAVDQIIKKRAEPKEAWTTSGNSLVQFNSSIDNTSEMLLVVPSLVENAEDNGRVGDQVTMRSLKISGYLKFGVNSGSSAEFLNDVTTFPHVIARLFVVSLKIRSNYQDAIGTATFLSSLLKKGGTTAAFTGVLSDIYAPVNTDLFTVHHDKKFYLSQDFINSQGASIPSQYMVQNVRDTVKFFSLSMKCKNKKLIYDDYTSSNQPTNYAPIMLLGYAYLDGSAPDNLNSRLGLHYSTVMTYDDF